MSETTELANVCLRAAEYKASTPDHHPWPLFLSLPYSQVYLATYLASPSSQSGQVLLSHHLWPQALSLAVFTHWGLDKPTIAAQSTASQTDTRLTSYPVLPKCPSFLSLHGYPALTNFNFILFKTGSRYVVLADLALD